MRIALVFDDSLDRPSGVAHYVKTLGLALARAGHDVTLLVGYSRSAHVNGVRVLSLSRNLNVRFNGSVGTTPLPARRRMLRLALSAPYDVVHVQLPFSPFMAGRIVRRLPRETALVGTFHVAPATWPSRIGAHLLGAIMARSLRSFDRLLSVSPEAADSARRFFRVIKSDIVPSMVDMELLRPAAPSDTGAASVRPPRIVYVGALVRRKNVSMLLDVVELLVGEFPTIRLAIIGEGPMRTKLDKKATLLGVAGNIDFHGEVSEARKRALLHHADVACFPARKGETFGVVVLEALAAGVPLVLGGDNPGYRSLLDESLLIDTSSPHEAAAKIRKYLYNGARPVPTVSVAAYDVPGVTARIADVYAEAQAMRRRDLASATGIRGGPRRLMPPKRHVTPATAGNGTAD